MKSKQKVSQTNKQSKQEKSKKRRRRKQYSKNIYESVDE